MEDLMAAGFKPNVFINPMHIEDLTALIVALADFHAAAWSMRKRLGYSDEMKTNVGSSADGFPKLDAFRDGLRAAVDSLRGQVGWLLLLACVCIVCFDGLLVEWSDIPRIPLS
jgi:hypothetical protein